MLRALVVTAAIVFGFATAARAQLTVVSTSPALNAAAAVTASVSVEFDRALDTGTLNASSFRVFGRGSGTASGTLTFSNGNKTVTLTPSDPFTAGEIVFVNLADNEFLDHKPGNYGYAVFGRVTDGMDVIDKIAAVGTGRRKGFDDCPLEDVVIRSVRRVAAA